MRATANRPKWDEPAPDFYALGDYTVRLVFRGSRHPWEVCFKGRPMVRRHGNYTGSQRFMHADNAKRWAERLIETPLFRRRMR